jgi:hypothetical protein
MGLDMYLCRKGGNKALSAEDLTYEQYKVLKPQWEVAYWRKANAIHAWFVDNVQGGKDDCGTYPVNLEQLAGLVQTCKEILLGYKTGKDALPTRGGFFFGGTGYDDWYRQDIESTIEQLEPLLTPEAITAGNTEYEYHASW